MALATLRDVSREPRWVAPELLHLTLVFLGDTEPGAVEAIGRALGEEAALHEPFAVTLGEPGFFGRRDDAVVWLGLARGGEELSELSAALERRLLPATGEGSAVERRHHLTLARRAPRRLVGEVAEALRPLGLLTWRAERMQLVRSHLGRSGPLHERLLEAELGPR